MNVVWIDCEAAFFSAEKLNETMIGSTDVLQLGWPEILFTIYSGHNYLA